MEVDDKVAIKWFRWMGAGGLVLSLVVFIIYITGLIPSFVPPSDSAALWSGSSKEYLAETGLVFTPGWFRNITSSYFLSTAALAVLASTALPTLVALGVRWYLKREFLYGSMALMISVVLIVAIIG